MEDSGHRRAVAGPGRPVGRGGPGRRSAGRAGPIRSARGGPLPTRASGASRG